MTKSEKAKRRRNGQAPKESRSRLAEYVSPEMRPGEPPLPAPIYLVPTVSDVDVAFGAGSVQALLPPWGALPNDFRNLRGPWVDQVERWFCRGGDAAWIERIEPKSGIDKFRALRAAKAILGSFEPKHEHKIGGVAYLLSVWFEDPALARGEKDPAP